MPTENAGYWARSLALLKRDQGWWKIILVMAIATFVPIAGPLGVLGYALEWGRLTAWGVDSSPKQKGVQVGKCISAGWRGFCASIGWIVIWTIITDVLFSGASGLMDTVVALLGICVGVVAMVCQLRATIYQEFKAGYQANRIVDMIKHDYKGLLRVAGLAVAMYAIFIIVSTILSQLVLLPVIMRLAGTGDVMARLYGMSGGYGYGMYDDAEVVAYILSLFAGVMPYAIVLLYLMMIAASFVQLIEVTAVALWMRQFNVPAWGNSKDPLPTPLAPLPAATAPAAPAPANPVVQQSEVPYAQPAAQPMPQQAPAPQSAPVAQPAPASQPVVNQPAPAPQPVVVPAPVPTPVVEPTPQPAPQPALQTMPTPQVASAPEVAPVDDSADEEVIPLAAAAVVDETPTVMVEPVTEPIVEPVTEVIAPVVAEDAADDAADEVPIVPVVAPAPAPEAEIRQETTEKDESDEKVADVAIANIPTPIMDDADSSAENGGLPAESSDDSDGEEDEPLG